MKNIICAVLLCFSSILFGQEIWRSIGADDANQPSWAKINYASFALDSQNNPYVFCQSQNYIREENAYVKKFDGIKWVSVGTPVVFIPNEDSAQEYAFHCIAIDRNDIPYVAYTHNGKISVKKFNGTEWIAIGSEQISTDNARYLKIQIDNNNVPYIVYSNHDYSDRITVKKFNGSSWESVGLELFSAGAALYTDLKIDSNNLLYVSYKDEVNGGKATVQKFDGSSWQIVGTPGFSMTIPLPSGNGWSATAIYYVSLAIDPNNVPYISYPGYVQKFNGSSWDYVGIGMIGDNTVPIRSCTLDFAIDGTPFLATQSNIYGAVSGFIEFQKFNGTSWELSGNTLPVEFEEFDVKSTFFAIGSDNIPQILYSDGTNGFKASVRKLVGSTWEFTGDIGYSNNIATYASLSSDIDNEGIIYSTYIDADDTVNVKRYIGNAWQDISSPSVGINLQSKIAIADDNTPYILIWHFTDSGKSNTVKKWNGTAWQFIGEFESTRPAFIAIDHNNVPYIAYLNAALQDAITVKRRIGESWQTVGIDGMSPSDSIIHSFLIDASNKPVIAYNSNFAPATIKKFDGNQWLSETEIPESLTSSEDVKLAFDSNNILYASSGNVVLKWQDNNWATLGNSFGGYISSLSIDQNDIPFVAFPSSNYKLSVAKFENEMWSTVGISEFTAAADPNEVSLLHSGNNSPIITYNSGQAFAKFFGDENALNIQLEIFKQADVTFYPNPVKDNFSINSKSAIDEISIYDFNGRKVHSQKCNGQNVDVSSIDSSLYILKVKYGSRISTLKFVKE